MAKDSMDDGLKDAVDKATGMIDMKRSKAEMKKDNGPVMATDSAEGPTYPYGLEIRLENTTLKKLGISKLPSVGDQMRLEAVAVVESVSEEETMRDGKKSEPRRHVALQIQKMSIGKGK